MIFGFLGFLVYLVGLTAVVYHTYRFFKFFLARNKKFPYDLTIRYGKNSHAIITGSTNPLGKAFANVLAKRGFNLVLIDSDSSQLGQLAESLKPLRAGIDIKTIAKDFTKASEKGFFEDVREQIKDLDVAFLVNNAGTFTPGRFDDLPEDKLQDDVNITCTAALMMTRLVVPLMLPRITLSAVINVSSVFADCPMPDFSAPSTTNAFTDYLARGLAMEYEGQIEFLSLRTGYSSTQQLAGEMKGSWKVAKPEDIVRAALDDLGHQEFSYGPLKQKLLAFLPSAVPELLLPFISPIISFRHLHNLNIKNNLEAKSHGKKRLHEGYTTPGQTTTYSEAKKVQ